MAQNPWGQIANLDLSALGDPSLMGGEVPVAAEPAQKIVPLKKNKKQVIGADRNALTETETFTDTAKNELRDQNKTQTERALQLTPDEVDPSVNYIRNLPEIQDQNDAIDLLNQELDNLRKQKTDNRPWLKPLIALTDSETGSNLMKGYEGGLSPKDKAAAIGKLVADIAKRKGDVSKNVLTGMRNMRAGSELQQLVQTAAQTGTQQVQNSTKELEDKGFRKTGKGGKGGPAWTPYEKALDTAFGKFSSEYLIGGGPASSLEDIATFDRAINFLNKNKNSTGAWEGNKAKLGNLVGIKTDLQQIADDIARTSAKALKSTFPGAISDSEREFIVNLSFDPKADAKTNVQRLQKARNIIKRASEKTAQAVEYANGEGRGSLRGFNWEHGKGSAAGATTYEDGKVRVLDKATGKIGRIPKGQLQKALSSGKYEEVK